jgi:hypothetical protein
MKELGDGMKTENEVYVRTSDLLNIMFKLFVLSNNKRILVRMRQPCIDTNKYPTAHTLIGRAKEPWKTPIVYCFIADTTLEG